LKLDNSVELKVIGVYQDMPGSSDFRNELSFIAPLEIEIKRGNRFLGWGNNWLLVFVQVAENVDVQQASLAIRDAKLKNVVEYDRRFKPELFLHPMNKWHLYSDFENGVNTGGRIEFVRLFGAIGVFVLLLACINFMNLSTARSQKRGKEVGVRKVIGSARSQLIRQFFSESLLVVVLAFAFSILLVQLFLPWFNEIASKNITVDWIDPKLWVVFFAFVLLTALIAGSYPALYLSAFSPVKVLKGALCREMKWSLCTESPNYIYNLSKLSATFRRKRPILEPLQYQNKRIIFQKPIRKHEPKISEIVQLF
jgi:putative ABC transport system permease protein